MRGPTISTSATRDGKGSIRTSGSRIGWRPPRNGRSTTCLPSTWKDYQQLFNRLTLDVGETPAETQKLTTAERLADYKQNKPDPDLEETLFQYAAVSDDQQFAARLHARQPAGAVEQPQPAAPGDPIITRT